MLGILPLILFVFLPTAYSLPTTPSLSEPLLSTQSESDPCQLHITNIMNKLSIPLIEHPTLSLSKYEIDAILTSIDNTSKMIERINAKDIFPHVLAVRVGIKLVREAIMAVENVSGVCVDMKRKVEVDGLVRERMESFTFAFGELVRGVGDVHRERGGIREKLSMMNMMRRMKCRLMSAF